jgi:hypothetical protein
LKSLLDKRGKDCRGKPLSREALQMRYNKPTLIASGNSPGRISNFLKEIE